MTNKEYYATYKWIKVKRYADDETKSWEERYESLDEHHLKETTFLIEEVRSLAERLDTVTEQTKIAEAKRKRDEKIAEHTRTFFIFWFGFSFLGLVIIDWFIDKQTQFQYHNWILGGILLFGLTCSSVLTYIKWKKS